MENPAGCEITEDLRQSEEYSRYMQSIGWQILQISNKHQIFIKKIGPVGIAKIQRTEEELPMGEIEKILKENHVMMCKIEPIYITPYPPLKLRGGTKGGDILKSFGYKLSNWPLLGTKTLRVNLRPNEGEILNSFKKDCRYVLRKIQDSKFNTQFDNFEKFYEIWRRSAKRKGLWIPRGKEYKSLITAFGDKCFCITIGDLAGALILTHKQTAFYYYAGSTTEGTRQNLPYAVVWEAMREAKKRKCRIWDFEGIYDSRWPNKGWVGFSHFKKSFGGEEVEFPGSFEKWRWPF